MPAEQSVLHSVDCYVLDLHSKTYSTDAYVQGLQPRSHSVDCYIPQGLLSYSHSIDCYVTQTVVPAFQPNAFQNDSLPQPPAFQVARFSGIFSYNVDCYVFSSTASFSHNVDARVQVDSSKVRSEE